MTNGQQLQIMYALGQQRTYRSGQALSASDVLVDSTHICVDARQTLFRTSDAHLNFRCRGRSRAIAQQPLKYSLV